MKLAYIADMHLYQTHTWLYELFIEFTLWILHKIVAEELCLDYICFSMSKVVST